MNYIYKYSALQLLCFGVTIDMCAILHLQGANRNNILNILLTKEKIPLYSTQFTLSGFKWHLIEN